MSSPDLQASQRAVFIIGAGRSGTSTVARAVAALGVDLGTHFKRASRKNPTGFFEDADLLALSKAVRNSLGIRADSVRLIDPDQLQGPALADLRTKAARLIRSRFGNSPIWGFKYGRTLRILPFWEPVLADLNIQPSFVIALRNPLSVARSRAKLDSRRGLQEASDLEWLVSIVPYLRRTRGHPLAVVDYDLLMDDPTGQLERITQALDLPHDDSRAGRITDYAERFINSGLRHTRFADADLDSAVDLNPLARDGYRLLRLLATGELDVRQDEFWSRWQTIEQGLDNIAPLLRLLDLRETERRRAIMSPLGPLQSFSILRNLLKR